MIGRALLHYKVLDRLGAGGMGEVWRAQDMRLDREVALKILPAGPGDSSVTRERLFREARTASSLIHPNIITIHEINSADGVDFIVMELVRGETLAAVLARGPLTVRQTVGYAVQIADAMAIAHEAGLVHRDLKPGNIMVTGAGLVKVLDFGIAKRVPGGPTEGERETVAALTVAGSLIGTPAYMSPEQALGDPLDARSDVFSFGVALYEMLTGALPFAGTTTLEQVRAVVHSPAPSIKEAVPGLPDGLAEIVERCLAKSPGDRYQHASDIAADLRRLSLDPSSDGSREIVTSVVAPVAIGRPKRYARVLLLLVGVMVIAAGAWIGGPAALRWIGGLGSQASQVSDEAASPQELYRRATERLGFYYREGNLDTAIAQLERALQAKSPYPQAEARLSLAYWRRNALGADVEWQKRALAHAERAVAGDGQLAMAHIAHGAALAMAGDLAAAAEAYGKAATLDPTNWELHWRSAALAIAQSPPDTAAAEQHYLRSVESGRDEWESHGQLGAFYYRQARYEDAIKAFATALELAPDQARMYSNLAAAYHQLGRDNDAAATLQTALEISPDSITYSNLGTYLYFQGKYPEAESAFDHAVELNANSYLRWGNLADAVRMNAPGSEKMHESYRRAIQLADESLAAAENTNVRSSVAVYLARDGQRARALQELEKILAAPKMAPAVLFKCALTAELVGQRARALELLDRAFGAGYSPREARSEPDFVRLRTDPAYHTMISRYER